MADSDPILQSMARAVALLEAGGKDCGVGLAKAESVGSGVLAFCLQGMDHQGEAESLVEAEGLRWGPLPSGRSQAAAVVEKGTGMGQGWS